MTRISSPFLRALFPLLGLAILAVLLVQADLTAVWRGIRDVGPGGVALILAIHLVAYGIDTVLWLMAFEKLPCTLRWTTRLFAVRLVGEAYNNATPFASIGGEPVKAKILKDRYDIAYQLSAMSFLVTKTANLVALGVFLAVGFGAMLLDPRFTSAQQAYAAMGLAALVVAIAIALGVQRHGAASGFARWFARRTRYERVRAALERLREFDDRLASFYRRRRARFVLITALAVGTWVGGALEIWVVLHALGIETSWLQVWVVEAVAQLVRVAAFFIPAGLGVMDASFVALLATLTGNPNHGVVVAIARRFRDLVWIAGGMLMAFPLARKR